MLSHVSGPRHTEQFLANCHICKYITTININTIVIQIICGAGSLFATKIISFIFF